MKGAVWCLALTLWGASSAAQVGGLDAMLDRGLALREAGHDAEALEVFGEAWAQTRSPRARAQMAMAEHALGFWVPAEQHLREALATSDPWIQRNRAILRGVLGVIEDHLARLELRGAPAGAEVRVDGEVVGALPMTAPVRLAAGARRLEVSAPGHVTMVRALSLRPGVVTREAVTLAPVLTGGAGPAASPVRTLAWVGVGLGGALLAGSLVTFALHESTVSHYDAHCLGRAAPYAAETLPCQDDRDQEATLRTLSTVGLSVGAGLGVLSAVLRLVVPSRRAGATALACAGGPGDVGVRCSWAF